jgi:hypothetical protein
LMPNSCDTDAHRIGAKRRFGVLAVPKKRECRISNRQL